MIIKGAVRTDGAALGDYLLSEGRYAHQQGENERLEIWEAPGIAQGLTLQELLTSHELSAAPTRCEKPLFHVQMRPADGEVLTRAQWMEAAERLEQRLGLAGHERVMVAHTKDGHEHLHLVWNRIDHEQQIAAPLHYYKRQCTAVARDLERDFGLRELADAREPGTLSRAEEQQALRHGEKPQAIKETIQACWAQADNGPAFAAALRERGLLLAQGDRRDFVIVDRNGGSYSVARVTGSRAAVVRERLADLSRADLPGVAEAQAQQREAQQRASVETDRMAEQRARNYEELKAQHAATQDEATQQAQQSAEAEEEQQKATIQHEEDQRKTAAEQEEQQKQAALREEDQRRVIAQQDEDRRQAAFREEDQRRTEAQQAEEARCQEGLQVERLAQENRDRQVEQAAEMKRQAEAAERLQAHREQVAREAAEARERAVRERAEALAYREGEISNAHYRYGQALQHYDLRDPYGSLAQCAMAEHTAFMRERAALDRQIAQTHDPTAREALELRKRIEGVEYMAITSDRIAGQSEVITGERNGAEAQKQRAQAADWRRQASEGRREWREMQARREMQAQEVKGAKAAKAAQKEDVKRDTATPQARRAAGKATTPETSRPKETQREAKPLMVQEKGGPPVTLAAFVKNLPEKPPKTAARPDVAEAIATRRHNEGLEGISRAVARDRPLAADDVRQLKPADREGIRRDGDAHVREMVQQRETERQRDTAPGRERERER